MAGRKGQLNKTFQKASKLVSYGLTQVAIKRATIVVWQPKSKSSPIVGEVDKVICDLSAKIKLMTYKKKKVEPAISQHFSKLAKRSWAVRKAKLLEKAKVGK